MKHTVFLKNAATLTVTSLILRTIGIFFRVYLSDKIGAEGMGLYQLIVSIYVLGSTFATAGISTAVTRLIADELACGTKKSVQHILRRSILISALIGVLSLLLIFWGAEWISTYWIRDVRAAPALKMLSFSLPSMGISSCLRGYFIARRKVSNSSTAQLLEQAVRIAVVFFLIDRFAAAGLSTACFAIMVGDTVAEWLSCLYMAVGYRRDSKRLAAESIQTVSTPRRLRVVRSLLAIAAPITAGRYLNTALRTIENILVPNSIAKYSGSAERGLAEFGTLKGMALPLIFFPASFLNALTTLLIPEISSANVLHQQGKINRAVEQALHITLLSSLLIGAVFTVFSRPIGLWLYKSEDVGLYLRVLAPLTPIMYAESIVDGILKGLNQQVSSLKYSTLDSAIRVVLIFVVVPRYGMAGFLGIMVISNVLTSFLNLNRLLTVTGVKIQWAKWILRPILGAVTASAISLGIVPLFSVLPSMISTILGILLLCGVYALLLPLLGCLNKSDLQRIIA